MRYFRRPPLYDFENNFRNHNTDTHDFTHFMLLEDSHMFQCFFFQIHNLEIGLTISTLDNLDNKKHAKKFDLRALER